MTTERRTTIGRMVEMGRQLGARLRNWCIHRLDCWFYPRHMAEIQEIKLSMAEDNQLLEELAQQRETATERLLERLEQLESTLAKERADHAAEVDRLKSAARDQDAETRLVIGQALAARDQARSERNVMEERFFKLRIELLTWAQKSLAGPDSVAAAIATMPDGCGDADHHNGMSKEQFRDEWAKVIAANPKPGQLLVSSPENPALVAATPEAVGRCLAQLAPVNSVAMTLDKWAVVGKSGERQSVDPTSIPVPGGT